MKKKNVRNLSDSQQKSTRQPFNLSAASRCYARIALYQYPYQFQYANYDFVTYKIRHLLGGTVAKFQLQNATNSIPW